MITKLILASSSPRRKEILEKLAVPFLVVPADIDESTRPDESPCLYVERLAQEKAQKVALQFPNAFVIGSDLTCDLDSQSVGKAKNSLEAGTMLANFSGKTHFGRCGYAVIKGSMVLGRGVATTVVNFKKLSTKQIADYLDSNQWVGLAGAYGVQNNGKNFLSSFQGSYYDILGLPIYQIAEILITYGFKISPDKIALLRQDDKNTLESLFIDN